MRTDIVQITLDDLKKFSISKMVLSPTRWANCCIPVSLAWTTVKFDKTNKNIIPEVQGVYTFIVKPSIAAHPECSYLLYVGKTERQNLRKRFLQYFDEPKRPKGREPIKHMVEHWETHLWFCFAPIEATLVSPK